MVGDGLREREREIGREGERKRGRGEKEEEEINKHTRKSVSNPKESITGIRPLTWYSASPRISNCITNHNVTHSGREE